jgi:hypothetical protein
MTEAARGWAAAGRPVVGIGNHVMATALFSKHAAAASGYLGPSVVAGPSCLGLDPG